MDIAVRYVSAAASARIGGDLYHRGAGQAGAFYPLEGSGALLGLPDLGAAVDRLIEDVLHHVGHALQDDAAILLIGR